MKNDGVVLLGAVVGGLLGYYIFHWLVKQGLYGLILPGGLLGLGAGLFRPKTVVAPVICGLLALAFELYTEWSFAPYQADPRLGYFLTHVNQLKPMTLMMIVLGTSIGFWVPFRRGREKA